MQKIIALILIIAISTTLIFSQDTTPAPYKPDEFPEWTVDLRRAEIVTIGSFPLSFIFTAIVYDLSLLAYDYSLYDSENASSILPQYGSHREQIDIIRLLSIAAGVSVAVGLTDFIIQRVKKNKIEKEQQELDEQRKIDSQSTGLSENEG